MPVTRRDDTAVRARWAEIATRADDVAVRFHENLVGFDHDVSALFVGTDAAAFKRQVANTLGEIVKAVERPEELVALCVPLGRQLAGRGVRERHYALAVEALADAFRETLRERFSTDVEEQCRSVMGLVCAVMQRTVPYARESTDEIRP